MIFLSDKKNRIHRHIYFWTLIATAISLPTSKALMSITPFLLLINWLWEGRLKEKISRFAGNPAIWLLPAIFGLYIAGLLWTNSLRWGLHDLKIQIPLLIFPLVIGTSPQLQFKEIKTILQWFAGATVFASLCSLYVWLGFSGTEIREVRDISLFVSHIRFALLINIAIFSLLWLSCSTKLQTPKKEKLIYFGIASWLTLFLFVLQSATGIIVFVAVVGILFFWLISRIQHVVLRFFLFVLLMMVPVFIGAYLTKCINSFYQLENVSEKELNETTQRGNVYHHDPTLKQLENGHYVFLFIAEDELREVWNQRSQFRFDSTYAGGFNKYVLYRYLTSKGLRKDAEGLSQLSDDDVANIEHGATNYRYTNKFSVSRRIYQIIWEFNEYQNGANPAGHSVTQRIEYFKIAVQVIRENFWFGTGTGGYYQAYQKKYDDHPFFSAPTYRQRSHNMWLSYWVDFGLFGLLFVCFAYTYPVFRQGKQRSFLLLTFSLIVLLSCINEDTLNNHDAITFVAFFFSLFLFSKYENGPLAE